MPQMSGRELALELARDAAGDEGAVSSPAIRTTRSRARLLEASSAFLQKPFTARALAEKVAELLSITT